MRFSFKDSFSTIVFISLENMSLLTFSDSFENHPAFRKLIQAFSYESQMTWEDIFMTENELADLAVRLEISQRKLAFPPYPTGFERWNILQISIGFRSLLILRSLEEAGYYEIWGSVADQNSILLLLLHQVCLYFFLT